jgi:hypothetical protein
VGELPGQVRVQEFKSMSLFPGRGPSHWHSGTRILQPREPPRGASRLVEVRRKGACQCNFRLQATRAMGSLQPTSDYAQAEDGPGRRFAPRGSGPARRGSSRSLLLALGEAAGPGPGHQSKRDASPRKRRSRAGRPPARPWDARLDGACGSVRMLSGKGHAPAGMMPRVPRPHLRSPSKSAVEPS